MTGTKFLLGLAIVIFGYGAVVILGAMAVQSGWMVGDSYVLRFCKTGVLGLGVITMFNGFSRNRKK